MSAVVKQKPKFTVFDFTVKRAVLQAGGHPDTSPLPQLEAGTLQLPRALQQADKMLYNKFFIKHFFPKETKAAAEHNVWLLIIYFSFLIPVTTWPCFHFCFTSEIDTLTTKL